MIVLTLMLDRHAEHTFCHCHNGRERGLSVTSKMHATATGNGQRAVQNRTTSSCQCFTVNTPERPNKYLVCSLCLPFFSSPFTNSPSIFTSSHNHLHISKKRHPHTQT